MGGEVGNLQARDKHNAVKKTRTNDRRFLQVFPRKELDWGKVSLPCIESRDANHSQHFHRDDIPTCPSLRGIRGKTEGEKYQGKNRRNQDNSNH